MGKVIHHFNMHFSPFFLANDLLGTSLVAQTVKRLPTVQETWVQSLGREDLLEKAGPRDDLSK